MSRQESLISDKRMVENIQNLDIIACYNCDKIFKSKQDFLRHCTNCKSTIKQYRIPSLKIKKDYKCKTCPEIFSMKKSLKNHYGKIHSQGRQCPFCDQVFKVKKSINKLLIHIKHMHDSESENDLFKNICDEYAVYKENVAHCCDKCGKVFTTNDSLKKHVNIVHGSETINCSKCPKIVKCLSSLRKHMRRQHSNIAVSCEYCGRLFERRERLRIHIQSIHMKMKNYKCNICDRRFAEQQHVRRHKLAVHEKLKPFTCLDCDFRTAVYGNLNLHRNNTHRKKNMPKAEYDRITKKTKDLSDGPTHM